MWNVRVETSVRVEIKEDSCILWFCSPFCDPKMHFPLVLLCVLVPVHILPALPVFQRSE